MATKAGAKNVPTLEDELLALQKALEKKSAVVWSGSFSIDAVCIEMRLRSVRRCPE